MSLGNTLSIYFKFSTFKMKCTVFILIKEMHIHTPDMSYFTTPNIHSIQIVKLQYKLLQYR